MGFALYNNGFAAGIVASVLTPVIIAVQARGAKARLLSSHASPD
jgi:hypothetical protein